MIFFVCKIDYKGLGYGGYVRLIFIGFFNKNNGVSYLDDEDDDEIMGGFGKFWYILLIDCKKKKDNKLWGGIGIGILNDMGFDDEDFYEIGFKIFYNWVVGGDKKKKKVMIMINFVVKVFLFRLLKKIVLEKIVLGVWKCYDGWLFFDGFVFGKELDVLILVISSEGKYLFF